MTKTKAEQRLTEIENLIEKTAQGIRRLKAYTEVVNDNQQLRNENTILRGSYRQFEEILSDATTHEIKVQELYAFVKKTRRDVDAKVKGNMR